MFLCKWRARKQISLHRDNKVVLYCTVQPTRQLIAAVLSHYWVSERPTALGYVIQPFCWLGWPHARYYGSLVGKRTATLYRIPLEITDFEANALSVTQSINTELSAVPFRSLFSKQVARTQNRIPFCPNPPACDSFRPNISASTPFTPATYYRHNTRRGQRRKPKLRHWAPCSVNQVT